MSFNIDSIYKIYLSKYNHCEMYYLFWVQKIKQNIMTIYPKIYSAIMSKNYFQYRHMIYNIDLNYKTYLSKYNHCEMYYLLKVQTQLLYIALFWLSILLTIYPNNNNKNKQTNYQTSKLGDAIYQLLVTLKHFFTKNFSIKLKVGVEGRHIYPIIGGTKRFLEGSQTFL